MYKFSYNITRKYPYEWLTPLVGAGSLIAIGVILFINIITESYDLVSTSTNNPKEVLKDGNPYSNSPHWLASFLKVTQATCTYTTLPLNSEIFTTNYVMPYTIKKIWHQNDDGSTENYGSLVYLDNPLLHCNVTDVTILVNGKYTQSALLSARSEVGLVIKPSATCAIEDVDTPKSKQNSTSAMTFFELEGSYNLIDGPHFLLRNATARPSLFWGESMLNLYYQVTTAAYFYAAAGEPWGINGADPNAYSAYITLSRQSSATVGSENEVMSDEFFRVSCFTEGGFCGNDTIPQLSGGTTPGVYWNQYPSIWSAVDVLGKAMWFTAMTDLGQNNATIPNMLAYPNLLANLTSNMTNEAQALKALNRDSYLDSSLETTPFDPSAMPPPALGAQTSYLSANYICQVPKPKSTGTRVVSILIASLVLLQSVWKAFFLSFNALVLERREDPSDQYCEGCVARDGKEGHVAGTIGKPSPSDLDDQDLNPFEDLRLPGETGVQRDDYTQVRQVERHID
ncbi:hypothetical protein CHU98_g11854 [Xylaria longipes]|nr:hypothetical protein CHU98_g11854 [Xylaria longipes]